MDCWGMGMTQTDGYCEVYERFMEEYDEGKPLSDIKQDILRDWLEEFDPNDGVLHDVYFAIGKAEWMCGGISADIFDRIAHIIRSGENIAFYRELGASESNLKLRRKNLDKFLILLSSPRGKTKKRKIPTDQYVKIEKPKLPDFRCGDIFAYRVGEKYRLLTFVGRGKFCTTQASYCYVWTKFYDVIPSLDVLREEPFMPLGYFLAEEFPSMEELTFVGNDPDIAKLASARPHMLYEHWRSATYMIVKAGNLSEAYPWELGVRFNACMKKLQM